MKCVISNVFSVMSNVEVIPMFNVFVFNFQLPGNTFNFCSLTVFYVLRAVYCCYYVMLCNFTICIMHVCMVFFVLC